jgi:hypothetical protein
MHQHDMSRRVIRSQLKAKAHHHHVSTTTLSLTVEDVLLFSCGLELVPGGAFLPVYQASDARETT